MNEVITSKKAEDFFLSIIPEIEKIRVYAKLRGIKSIVGIAVSEDGYVDAYLCDADYRLCRVSAEDKYFIRSEKELEVTG